MSLCQHLPSQLYRIVGEQRYTPRVYFAVRALLPMRRELPLI